MSRFGGRGRSSSKKSSSRGGRGSARGRSNRRNSRRSSKKSSGGEFQNIGSLAVSKDTDEGIVDELRDFPETKLWWRVFLPEGVDSLTLKRDEYVFIQLGRYHEDAPDFVVGSVSLPPESDE